MRPRDASESNRAASTLELFFDLVFVIAVSQASTSLHHMLAEGDWAGGLPRYLLAFFAIWWAWMNFTWFSTSFDTDDWLYRVLTIAQMGGVLLFAAGIEPMFTEDSFALMIAGYVVMRIAMVLQWLRAATGGGPTRRTALVYAAGIAIAQALWVAWLFVPESPARTAFLIVLVLCEIAVPVVAESAGRARTPWHPEHITERYGCFTLILLGESLLGSANAVFSARADVDSLTSLVELAVLALIVTASLWWIYFWPPHHRAIGSFASSLRYGYVHYIVFAAAGAFSAGIEVEIAVLTGESELSELAASFTVTIPIAVFILGIWWIAFRGNADRVVNTVVPAGALLVLLDPLIPVPIALSTIVCIAVVAVLVVRRPVPEDELPNDQLSDQADASA